MTSQPNAEYLDSPSDEIDEVISQGATASVDPDVADHMGAFEETALSDDEAQLSFLNIDLVSGEVLDEGDFE